MDDDLDSMLMALATPAGPTETTTTKKKSKPTKKKTKKHKGSDIESSANYNSSDIESSDGEIDETFEFGKDLMSGPKDRARFAGLDL